MKYKQLRARMVEQELDGIHLSQILRISRATMSHKLCAKTSWSSEEIITLCKALSIPAGEIPRYFFPNQYAASVAEDEISQLRRAKERAL
jgi:hypothetical protein